MIKVRIISLILIIATFALGLFVYQTEKSGASFPFKLGLDLSGGTELIYEADLSGIASEDADNVMVSLREVIERRVNDRDVAGVLGVLDPVIQIEKTGILTGETHHRLVVELPGVSDLDKAKEFIDRTPLLEFKLLKPDVNFEEESSLSEEEIFIDSGLTGQFLKDARFELADSGVGFIEPVVSIQFDKEGEELFASITSEHVGEVLAIFLDGVPISLPTIREEIRGGQAIISGDFEREEARELARNLKLGATPVPISLISAQKIGPTLGQDTIKSGIKAGIIGLLIVALFLVTWYRLSGLVAVFSLSLYVILMLSLFKLIPVTLTASGLAGFILSIGMAVDANIIIFERLKEEMRERENLKEAIKEAFSRAWLSIRDANISSLLIALVLFSMFKVSLVRGFALVFGIGVLISMFTAVVVTKTFLMSVSKEKVNTQARFLFGSGFSKNQGDRTGGRP